MGKRWKQGAVSLLSASALMALGQGAYAATSAETIPAWAAAEIQTWQELGLLKGDENGLVRPNGAVTRAELAAMLNRMYGYGTGSAASFADVPAQAWYAADIAKVAAAGIMQGDAAGNATPLANVTREQAAVMLGRALHLSAASSAGSLADEGQIAAWAKDAVHALQAAGYITGTPAGEFQPKKSLTRAEAVKMLNGAMGTLIADGGAHDGVSGGNLTVNKPGARLTGLKLTGSLYIAPGVGEGEVTIDGSNVGGTVYVLGGGAHTVVLKDTKAARLVVDKASGDIRVKLEGDTNIASVEFASGGELDNGSAQPVGIVVIKAKPSDTVQWKGDATELTFTSGLSFQGGTGHISKFTADSGLKNAKIELASDFALDTFTANGPVQVTGDGKIATAVINAEGVELSKAPILLTLNASSAKVGGETKTGSGTGSTAGTGGTTGSNGGNNGGETSGNNGGETGGNNGGETGGNNGGETGGNNGGETGGNNGGETGGNNGGETGGNNGGETGGNNGGETGGNNGGETGGNNGGETGGNNGGETSGNNGGETDLSTKLYSYAEASAKLGSATAELQVKQYIAFLQDPTYKPSIANKATAVPNLTNATTFVNASFNVKPSIFASLRGVNTSVLDASRASLWLGTNAGVTRVRLSDNEMKSYTLASGDLKDDKVLLLISDGKTGVYAITETGVSHIQK
ncbi:S-layer homology domain-containing protein [Cohnella sp. GbtcB17]|uniref:S-layer homology domain-containing protein n=1 Tax=Cohnella sp. GbtcB17 TaxID=2824762 RepID=UPI001C3012C5|nr:S-layer homology domain-containing protein [Cohnella sp. GbtcB17]